MIDCHSKPQFLCGALYGHCEIQHRELLGELLEYTEFTGSRGIEARQFDATHRIADIKKATRLAAFAVNRQRMPDSGLRAEVIQYCAQHVVVVEAVDQPFIKYCIIRHGAVDHSLLQVCGAQSPDLAAERDIMAVMNL